MDRIDASVARQVASLRAPDDAAASIVELVPGSTALVRGDPVNEALFSADGRWLVTALEFGEARAFPEQYLVRALVPRQDPSLLDPDVLLPAVGQVGSFVLRWRCRARAGVLVEADRAGSTCR
jgi:hypothetical protein